jgi:hypothetical protein
MVFTIKIMEDQSLIGVTNTHWTNPCKLQSKMEEGYVIHKKLMSYWWIQDNSFQTWNLWLQFMITLSMIMIGTIWNLRNSSNYHFAQRISLNSTFVFLSILLSGIIIHIWNHNIKITHINYHLGVIISTILIKIQDILHFGLVQ